MINKNTKKLALTVQWSHTATGRLTNSCKILISLHISPDYSASTS